MVLFPFDQSNLLYLALRLSHSFGLRWLNTGTSGFLSASMVNRTFDPTLTPLAPTMAATPPFLTAAAARLAAPRPLPGATNSEVNSNPYLRFGPSNRQLSEVSQFTPSCGSLDAAQGKTSARFHCSPKTSSRFCSHPRL